MDYGHTRNDTLASETDESEDTLGNRGCGGDANTSSDYSGASRDGGPLSSRIPPFLPVINVATRTNTVYRGRQFSRGTWKRSSLKCLLGADDRMNCVTIRSGIVNLNTGELEPGSRRTGGRRIIGILTMAIRLGSMSPCST